jgi:hypothetical protein
MNVLIIALSLFAATPSPSAAIVSPQLLVGEWRSEQGGTYHFHANGTCSFHAADEGWDGQWKLNGGRQLELLFGKDREIIVIDRVVHETLYVRTKYQGEVWRKQPRS